MLFIPKHGEAVPKNWRETLRRRAERLEQAEQDDIKYREENFSKRGGVILEWTEVEGNNDQPARKIPFYWICGNGDGRLIDPPEITPEDDPVHFVAPAKDTRDSSKIECHGTLPHHPTLSDAKAWDMPAWREFREAAIQEANASNETTIH
ncbi:hypothetical protein A2810_00265 [candidate division Kazan bacterium RIFCSPHIGHO2_01_FULL_49_10]|uniref:Uncharacterized protein n=1 Tax=candidate division Kazan bacterium RIFCSPLOWO2_01_FULL_48_13 TaxID=1798539 RepID=A0A1F4PPI4_UNCK3|nr:MAG: hypothetical protein A2810_00265 [candidate division Kazan bacterium RIFCSPHIGHO2_01_FULL_49_10]OGB85581.1 MAG: hypothetical protein A2994_00985 [candidate division Kazan bacterium RIFCSPLOWO2_01_FULL_48_13]